MVVSATPTTEPTSIQRRIRHEYITGRDEQPFCERFVFDVCEARYMAAAAIDVYTLLCIQTTDA
jgi:hypothetical protein